MGAPTWCVLCLICILLGCCLGGATFCCNTCCAVWPPLLLCPRPPLLFAPPAPQTISFAATRRSPLLERVCASALMQKLLRRLAPVLCTGARPLKRSPGL